ncbi:hypothetical protein [Desulfurobacterium sp.]
MSERTEQQKKRLTPAEIYRVAAEIYESLPEEYRGLIVRALGEIAHTENLIRPLTKKEG